MVYGDAAYDSGANLARLQALEATAMVKVQPPPGHGGRFTKDRFTIDPDAGIVVCRAGGIEIAGSAGRVSIWYWDGATRRGRPWRASRRPRVRVRAS